MSIHGASTLEKSRYKPDQNRVRGFRLVAVMGQSRPDRGHIVHHLRPQIPRKVSRGVELQCLQRCLIIVSLHS